MLLILLEKILQVMLMFLDFFLNAKILSRLLISYKELYILRARGYHVLYTVNKTVML